MDLDGVEIVTITGASLSLILLCPSLAFQLRIKLWEKLERGKLSRSHIKMPLRHLFPIKTKVARFCDRFEEM